MTLVLTESVVERCLGVEQMPRAVELIEEAYRHKARGKASLHRRVTVQYPPDQGYYTGVSIRFLPAILPQMSSAAVRIYSLSHAQSGGRGSDVRLDHTIGQEMVLYYRYARGMELAAIIANYRMMNVRTGAPTGVATRYLSREDSAVLGVLGSGRHAEWQIAAVCCVRPIEEVRIFSPTEANRRRLAERLDDQMDQTVRAVDSGERAIRDADVIVTVTNANRPVIAWDWVRPGAHINVIARGEVDHETILHADYRACSWREQILNDTPPFAPVAELLNRGAVSAEDFHDLAELVEYQSVGRKAEDDVTVFLSQGVGLWDTAIASWVYELAREKGLGFSIDLSE